ncbi:MAG: metallophosphoesterase [Pseudomonadota bacterium]
MRRLLELLRPSGRATPPAGAPAAEPDGPLPAPDRLTYVIGDIHGCAPQLRSLLARIAEDAADTPHDMIFLGDYIDRGPDSADVLRLLMTLDDAQGSDGRLTFLAGNHDHMLLHYLGAPEDGVRWLWVGGRDTLTSFGIPELRIGGDAEDPMAARVIAQAEALAQAMGEPMIQWLADRPLWWRSGNVVAVHALTDPKIPMEDQSDETLLWARPDDTLTPRVDGTWVVHGHTIVAAPSVRARHINVDTGAFQSGVLTAAVLAPGKAPRFLTSEGSGSSERED